MAEAELNPAATANAATAAAVTAATEGEEAPVKKEQIAFNYSYRGCTRVDWWGRWRLDVVLRQEKERSRRSGTNA